MKSSAKPLPDDLDVLKAMVLKLQSELTTEQAKNKHLSDYISQLIEAIKLAKQQHFGPRSEKSNGEQLSLPFNEAEALADHERDQQDEGVEREKDTTTVASHQRRKGGRRPLPDHYPRINVIHVLDESDCQCNHCKEELVEMGEKISEQIDLVPLTVRVIRHIRKTSIVARTVKAA